MKVNLKEFDAKQFLLEKGEQVGLGVALFLMVLMILLSLFVPSRGFFSGSPSGKAKPLTEAAKRLDNDLRHREPSDSDKPGTSAGKLIELNTTMLAATPYTVNSGWYTPNAADNPARRPPEIKLIDEAVARYFAGQVDTYVPSNGFNRILVYSDKQASTPGPGQPPGSPGGPPGMNMSQMSRMMQGMSSMQGRMQNVMGGRNIGILNNNGSNKIVGHSGAEDIQTEFVPIEKAEGRAKVHQLRPVRMALIAASFPYKAQLEEFKNKLHLSSLDAVRVETVEEDGKQLDAFRFLGVRVQRREVDGNGKPLTEYKDVDLNASYRYWLAYTLKPFEPDNSKYQAISPYGLVMPRLRLFRENPEEAVAAMPMMMGPGMMRPPGGRMQPPGSPLQPPAGDSPPSNEPRYPYPKVEDEVGKLKDTLKALDEAGPKLVTALPTRVNTGDINVFDINAGSEADKSNQGQNTGGKPAETKEDSLVPEHCLVRVIDVTIEPGKIYQYRLQVRMANPNYGKPDVASPAYKADKELKPKTERWYEVPELVRVPNELIYYAVDQQFVKEKVAPDDNKSARPKPYKGINANVRVGPDQVALQLHRWIDATTVGKEKEVIVGDWAVADRVIVSRGEYIGRRVKIELPIWKSSQKAFVIPAESKTRRKNTGAEVSFGCDRPDGRETILVDFEGGRQTYEHIVGKTEEGGNKTSKVDDTSALEVLMLTPDGKLLARNSAADSADEDREPRRHAFHQRVEEIKAGKSGPGAGQGTGLDQPTRPGGKQPGR